VADKRVPTNQYSSAANALSKLEALSGYLWKTADFDLGRQQQNIRRQFHIDTTVKRLLAEYGGALC